MLNLLYIYSLQWTYCIYEGWKINYVFFFSKIGKEIFFLSCLLTCLHTYCTYLNLWVGAKQTNRLINLHLNVYWKCSNVSIVSLNIQLSRYLDRWINRHLYYYTIQYLTWYILSKSWSDLILSTRVSYI